MTRSLPRCADRVAHQILLRGRVQGVGLRPAVARLAAALQLSGFVRNDLGRVTIAVEGPVSAVARFESLLSDQLPPAARVDSLTVLPIDVMDCSGFHIVTGTADGKEVTWVPPDRRVCDECLSDVAEEGNRRLGYAFTSCVHCGPRYSLIRELPYERELTSMRLFAMCATCQREYDLLSDRRGHSQTNCCPACGPKLWFVSGDAGASDTHEPRLQTEFLEASPIEEAAGVLLAGGVVAVKGVGGYQLLSRADNSSAVGRLRQLKQRAGKPLAVMVSDIAAARELSCFDAPEADWLTSAENPIVVVPQRDDAMLCQQLNPGLTTVGVMLPTTPVHAELCRLVGRPLVVTSGNVEGDPLEFEPSSADPKLAGLSNGRLHHDRPIMNPVDDSVTQFVAGRVATIRLARGLAPLPLKLSCKEPVLAVGGQQKVAIALGHSDGSVLGPHLGNMNTPSMRQRFQDHVRELSSVYRFAPKCIVHDLHPNYFTTQWSAQQSVATLGVQHHHAHVMATMLEHGWLNREVLGVAFDGTGLGTDGTIWGGEFLVVRGAEFERVGSLRPFPLLGGDRAVREPWRVLLALLHRSLNQAEVQDVVDQLEALRNSAAEDGLRLISRSVQCAESTSGGRLFDGVAALLLAVDRADFEGQPAMWLESAADQRDRHLEPLPIAMQSGRLQIDWRPLIRHLSRELLSGTSADCLAMRFHRSLARGIVDVCRGFPELPIVLSGGVFQNRLLTELIVDELIRGSREVGLPATIPSNDGGLAAGQLAIAAATFSSESRD